MRGIGIFAILGRYSPAAREELLGWIEDELARDEQRLGRPLDYDDMQRSYSRAYRKWKRRPTFTATEARKSSLRLVK